MYPFPPPGDGIALTSAAHPRSPTELLPSRLAKASLERISINVELNLTAANCPEIAYAMSTPECNDEHGPAALLRVARARAEARLARKWERRARYRRQYRRRAKTRHG